MPSFQFFFRRVLIFFRKLIYRAVINTLPKINPTPFTAILLLTTSSWSRLQVELITQYVFEVLNVPTFSTISTALCASFAYNVQNSLIIDIGKDKTEITPIVDFAPVAVSTRTIPYGSSSINKALKKLLPDLSDVQIEALKKSDIFQVLTPEEVAKGYSWFNTDDSTSTKNPEEDGVVDVAAIVTSGRTREILAQREKEKQQALEDRRTGVSKEKEKPNEEREFNSFPDPDTAEPIKVGGARFQGSTILIEKIVTAVGEVLKHLDEASKRQDCWDNIVILGRGSSVKGLKEALVVSLQARYIVTRPTMGSELPSMFNTSGYNTPNNGGPGTPAGGISTPIGGAPIATSASGHAGHGQVPTQIRVAKPFDYFIEWKNYGWEEASFLGAEIAAQQIFSGAHENTFASRTDYNAIGPSVVWDLTL